MDSEEFRAILSRSGVDIWSMIDTAIRVASSDYGDELRHRRDKIVESLYTPASQFCQNCNGGIHDDVVHDHSPYIPENIKNSDHNIIESRYDDNKKRDNDYNNSYRNSNDDFVNNKSPLTPESNNRSVSGGEDEDDVDPFAGLFDDEQTTILSIKEQLEDPNQTEDAVVELLQNLADMDITFQALQETDIGRHANRLRKHPSNDVRVLVKQLVSKWKEAVDEWVKVNQVLGTSNLIADGDSPQQNMPRNQQNGHHQGPDFGYSPNPKSGSSSVERNYSKHETKPKVPQSAPRKEAPLRPSKSVSKASSVPPPNKVSRESAVDDERLNSARRRLQENYQEANNAKRQRTIQVMDIHEIPKPKNSYFAKNKGGFKGKNHR